MTHPYSCYKMLALDDALAEPSRPRTKGAYFIGKLLWQKGLGELASLLVASQKEFGGDLPDGAIHVVGDGKDRRAIEARFRSLKVPSVFHGRVDHADELCRDFRVLVNPSQYRGAVHDRRGSVSHGQVGAHSQAPSNEFFYDFRRVCPSTRKRICREVRYAGAPRAAAPVSEGAAAAVLGRGHRALQMRRSAVFGTAALPPRLACFCTSTSGADFGGTSSAVSRARG